MMNDLVVLELASVLAGPATGMFFAELGARVIKVENPHSGGDVTRSWKLPTESPDTGISGYFSSVNWGKESIALDLKTEKGRQIIYDLIPHTDIVISSFLPGKDTYLKLDAGTLREINPGLICAEISGYGPNASRPAYDAIVQAEAGFTYMNGTRGNVSKMPVALVDLLAAHQIKEAILLAYIKKLKTGEGNIVRVSLIEAAISSLANQATNWLVANTVPQPVGSEHPNIVPYGTIFQTRDGASLVLAVGTDLQFRKLCKILNLPLKEHWLTNQQRVQSRNEVVAILSDKIRNRYRDALLEDLHREKVPAGALLNMKEVFESTYSQNLLLHAPGLKGLATFAAKGNFDTQGQTLSRPPFLGEHNDKILKALAYSDNEIQDLYVESIIRRAYKKG